MTQGEVTQVEVTQGEVTEGEVTEGEVIQQSTHEPGGSPAAPVPLQDASAGGFQPGWLTGMRWGITAGMTAATWITYSVLGFELPLDRVGFFLGLMLGVSLLSTLMQHSGRWKGRLVQTLLLVVDVLALGGVLLYSGGPFNPFSALYLAYVALAVVVLGSRAGWLLVVLSGGLYGAILVGFDSSAIPHGHSADEILAIHLQGVWMALVIVGAFIVVFVGRVRRELDLQSKALREARESALEARQLASLGTLAAGAAHELGTPLGSIALVAKELELALSHEASAGAQLPHEIMEDVAVINTEVARCRTILDQLSARSGHTVGDIPREHAVGPLLQEVVDGLADAGRVELRFDAAAAAENVAVPRRSLIHSLRAVITNGLQASAPDQGVVVELARRRARLTITVTDAGSGMSPEVLARAMDPFFSTKPEGSGMGLGLYLTRQVLDEIGGSLTIASRPGEGTTVRIVLPSTSREQPGEHGNV